MATIQGIYLALFGRPADPAGLAYFSDVTNDGADLTAIGDLAATEEYQSRFEDMSNAAIVNSIYQSLFGRDAEPGGLAFFLEALESGLYTINTIAIAILDGAQGDDLLTINAKLAAADLFTTQLDLDIEVDAYAGDFAGSVGRDYLAGVDLDNPSTSEAADTAILRLFDEGQGPGENPGESPGENTAPVAVNDAVSVDEDQSLLNINVLGNDIDVDGDRLTISVTPRATNGIVTVNRDGSLNYTPDANFFGSETITYVVTDGPEEDTGTLTITVNPVNDAPVAGNDSAVTSEDQPLQSINVLGNDSDVDGDVLFISGTPTAAHGVVTVNPDGTLNYAPDPDFFGIDVITYVVSDGQLTDASSLTITVGAVNDAPLAIDDALAGTLEDTAVTFDVGNLLANDTDVESDTLTITSVSGAVNGTVVLNQNGTITFTPTADYNGAASFNYTISDGNGGTNTATATLTVTAVNDAPMGAADNYSVNEDGTLIVGALAGLLANDSDVDSAGLSVAVYSGPANGSLTVNMDGSFTYIPLANFNGSDSFTYQATDGAAISAPTTVTITVNAINDAPVAVDDALTATLEDTAVTFAALDLLGNDSDVDGGPLTIASVQGAINGTVLINQNGTVTFTPTADYFGPASFTYTIADGNGGFDTATASFTVTAVNDAPVGTADNYSLNEDGTLTVSALTGVLANDSDIDNVILSVAGLVTGPANGSLTVNMDGSFTYTPVADFNGSDTFTYQATDGTALSAPTTVTITVNAVNDTPVAVDDALTGTLEDVAVTFTALDLLGNDTDVDGDPITITSVQGAVNGTVLINQNGTVTFTPTADHNGPASFTYTIADGKGGTDTGTATFTVTPVNDAPVAVDDVASTNENQSLQNINVLGNDTDVDGNTLSISGTPTSSHGTVTVNNDGTLNYSPSPDYFGIDVVTYTVTDGLATDSGTLTITVNEVVQSGTTYTLGTFVNVVLGANDKIKVLDASVSTNLIDNGGLEIGELLPFSDQLPTGPTLALGNVTAFGVILFNTQLDPSATLSSTAASNGSELFKGLRDNPGSAAISDITINGTTTPWSGFVVAYDDNDAFVYFAYSTDTSLQAGDLSLVAVFQDVGLAGLAFADFDTTVLA